MALILASRSPRRRELLTKLFPDFICENADIDETELCAGITDPEQVVRTLACAKALAVADKYDHTDFVIGADTVVASDTILGKPKDRSDACRMLASLSGKAHHVYSGVALVHEGQVYCDCDITQVRFRELTNEEICAYVDGEKPFDKAGAYGIQEKACLFISGITGDFYGVMGLPLFKLGILFEKAGLHIL